MFKKFLATASVLGLVAGTASALVVENESAGNGNVNAPVLLASQLDYAGGAVVSGANETQVQFYPTGAAFPTGNVLVYVDVTGATFDGALDGTEVEGTGTSVISQGGANGGTSVVFLVSGADACAVATPCAIDLPLELTGSDVTFSVGLQTDAGAPVDNSSATTRVNTTVVDIENAFSIEFDADPTAPIADLNSTTGPFENFLGGGATSTQDLGDVTVEANSVTYFAGTPAQETVAATDDLGVVAGVDAADVAGVSFVLTGQMEPFDTAAGLGVQVGGVQATESAATDTATITAAAGAGLFGGTSAVTVTDDATTPIERSTYSLAVEIVVAAASDLTDGLAASGALSPITRNGTQITFPWTQSATQGAASGVNSVFRFGNLDSTPAGQVFVEVKNSSAAGYTNPGIVSLAPSIAANGELVTNSTSLEALLGNYGRGDLEFTIEADDATLTGRQFVVRNGVIQNVIGGTIDQDLN